MRAGIVRLAGAESGARAASHDRQVQMLGSDFVRFDDQVLVWDGSLEAARSARLDVREASAEPSLAELRLVIQVGQVFQHEHPEVPVVLDKGRFLVVRLDDAGVERIGAPDEVCYEVRPLPVGSTVFRTIEPDARAPDSAIQSLLAGVSRTSVESYLTRLAGFPTRHSLSDHFLTAATWAQDELQRLGFTTQLAEISVDSGTSRNVIADLAGGGPDPRDLVVVSAHLDSVNIAGGPSAPAPGADDNGSGAAALLEMGRVLAGRPGGHDLRLILFGGEEQGLFGSRQYVAALPDADRARLRTVINMDMVATLNTPRRTVLLEGAAVSQAVMNELAAAAATYTSLVVQTSLDPFASDHVPFIDASLPAVLTIEGADRGNADVHTARDTLANIDYELALEIIRMNVAVTAGVLGTA